MGLETTGSDFGLEGSMPRLITETTYLFAILESVNFTLIGSNCFENIFFT